ncbi:MAG: ATP-binding cassette domain-containing protein [Lachnospiraceae bacterium]|nr:ATP-binding cassette domain-containing protein [Lachnospiraceae bacterium]
MGDNERTVLFDEQMLEQYQRDKSNKSSLVIVDRNGIKEYDLSQFEDGAYTFGRNENNSIPLNSSIVSGNHGEIYIQGGQFFIKDNASSNGSYIAYGTQFVQMIPNQYYGGNGKDMIIRLGTNQSMDGIDPVLLLYTARQANGRWKTFELKAGDTSIGRAENCDIRLKNVAVSRYHAGVRNANGQYYVFDNGSTNGVFVNGSRIQKSYHLSNKDIFTVLNTTFIYDGNVVYYKVNPEGIALEIHDLNKDVPAKGGKKTILDKVSLSIEPNEFVAIIGGSGAGKTTLMTAMSGFDSKVTGRVYCNGTNLRENFQTLKNIIGFVPQQDIIYENITLKKMLYYTAKMKMPEDTSTAEIDARIEEVLGMVELSEHKDTYIRRLSGGQKKRASIAVELLANPGLFFLDEPTSGLDPGTEEHLMRTLSKLSKEQEKTIIMVTHTINNLDLCDKVIIMGYGGRLCYCGSPAGIKDFFQTDDLVKVYDIITADPKGWESRFRMSGINQVSEHAAESNGEAIKPRKVNGFTQLGILVRRYTTLIMNDMQRLALIFGQPLIIGLLLTLVAGPDIYQKFTETQSILFTLMSGGIWMGLLNTIQEVNKERVILKREYMGNLKLPVYMLSKYIVQGVISLVQAVILVVTFVLVKGTPSCKGVIISNATIEIIVLIFLTIYASAGMGLLLSSITKSADRAMAIAPFVLIIQLIFSGILFELTGATDKISYVTFSRWAMESIGSTCDLNELEPPGQEESDSVEEQFDDLVATCNDAIAEMQEAYDEQINELQDAVETYSALANNPQTFEEYTSEPQTIEAEYEAAETEDNKMYVRSKARTVRSWLILYGSTFLCAGISVLVLRKLKDEQR